MSEKRLLLPSAKIGILVEKARVREYVRWLFFFVGVGVVFIGAASALSKLEGAVFGDDVLQTAFAPLGTLGALPPTVSTTTPLVPARVTIPSIGVDAGIEQVQKKADGSMATPKKFEEVGWYSLGSKPGEQGSAIFAGHVNNALTQGGVFEHLSQVSVGDYITVSDASGRTLVYVVYETNQYNTTEAPAAEIFSGAGPSRLVLITCDGQWDPAKRTYDKRFVLYARLTAN